MTTIGAAVCASAFEAVWTPWLAVTGRQVKGLGVLALAALALAVAAYLVVRTIRTFRRADDGVLPPEDPAAPPASNDGAGEAPHARIVDAGIANLLEQAASVDGDERSDDALFRSAVGVVVELGGVSIPAIQRRLHLDFDRVARLVDRMEEEGLVSAAGPGGKRKVLPAADAYVGTPERPGTRPS